MAAGDLKKVSIKRELAQEIFRTHFVDDYLEADGYPTLYGCQLVLDFPESGYSDPIENAQDYLINQGNGVAFANIAIPVEAGNSVGSIIIQRRVNGVWYDFYTIELMPENQQEIDSITFENNGLFYITSLLFEFTNTH